MIETQQALSCYRSGQVWQNQDGPVVVPPARCAPPPTAAARRSASARSASAARGALLGGGPGGLDLGLAGGRVAELPRGGMDSAGCRRGWPPASLAMSARHGACRYWQMANVTRRKPSPTTLSAPFSRSCLETIDF